MFHLNVKSLPKHNDELELYLESINLKFSFDALTETWLDDSKHDLYGFNDYQVHQRYRKGKKEVECHYS